MLCVCYPFGDLLRYWTAPYVMYNALAGLCHAILLRHIVGLHPILYVYGPFRA